MMLSLRAPRARRPSRARTRTIAGLAVLLLLAAQPGLALAAAPANDLPGGAVAIGAIPAHVTQDTTDATVTTDDVGCGSGGLDQATVWYSLTLSEAASILVDASASGFRVGINAFAGTASAETLVDCSEQGLRLDVEANATILLMFADVDGEANGGQLDVHIDVAPPPIDLSLTVDPVGKVNPQTGEAMITGSVTCTTATSDMFVDVELRQAVGRFTVRGFGGSGMDCGPAPTQWALSVVADSGRFGPGKSTVNVSAFACDVFTCDDVFESISVRLRK
jgi:hypothetical protein